MTEPCYDIAHLGHVEMLNNRFEESLAFCTEVSGLTVSWHDETSVYLQACDDCEFDTLKVTECEISAATSCVLEGSPVAGLVEIPENGRFRIEHSIGAAEVLRERHEGGAVTRTGGAKPFDRGVFSAP